MTVTWFEAHNYSNNTVMLSKDGSFRFKKHTIKKFNITNDTRFLIGQNSEDKVLTFYFAIVKGDHRAFKITNRVNGWTLSGKGIIKRLGLQNRLPIEFDVSTFKYEEKDCIKLIEKSKDFSEQPRVKVKIRTCECGKKYTPSKPFQVYCDDCQKENPKDIITIKPKRKYTKKPKVIEEPVVEPIKEKIRVIPPGMTGDELVGRNQLKPEDIDPKTGRPNNSTDPFN
jgi:hypothetical protein